MAQAYSAQEAFFSGTLGGVTPITFIDGRSIGSAAREKFEELCIEYEFTPLTCHVITRVSSMTWAILQQRHLVTLVPNSVFQQIKNAHQLTTLKLKDKLPFDPLGLLLPDKDKSMATQSVFKF